MELDKHPHVRHFFPKMRCAIYRIGDGFLSFFKPTKNIDHTEEEYCLFSDSKA